MKFYSIASVLTNGIEEIHGYLTALPHATYVHSLEVTPDEYPRMEVLNKECFATFDEALEAAYAVIQAELDKIRAEIRKLEALHRSLDPAAVNPSPVNPINPTNPV